MNEHELRIGCQTFTWEMLGPRWQGGPDDLLCSIAAAGYAGIEITDVMIGHYADRPQAFAEALREHGLLLTAFAFGSDTGFTVRNGLAGDLETTMRWVEFARHFPSPMISIGSATVTSGGSREEKFEIAAEFYNEAGRLGEKAGVGVAVHPSSHRDTLLYDREDYDRLFASLDAERVGWVPDTGHILRGHANLLETLQAHRERIRYIHLKDVDTNGDWVMLGEGVCDVSAVIDVVRASPRFNGWVVLEEESDVAAANPDEAVRANLEVLGTLVHSS